MVYLNTIAVQSTVINAKSLYSGPLAQKEVELFGAITSIMSGNPFVEEK